MQIDVGITEVLAFAAIIVTAFYAHRNQKRTEKKEASLELKAAEKEANEQRWQSIQRMAEENSVHIATLEKDYDTWKMEQLGKYPERRELSELEDRIEKRFKEFETRIRSELKEDREQLKELLTQTIKASLNGAN